MINNVKRVLVVFILLCAFNYSCDSTQENVNGNLSDEFIVDITSDKETRIDGVSENINTLKSRVYFENILLDYPKAYYAGFYVGWLTTPKALEFNATEGMKEDVYQNFFEKYGNYMHEQIINNKKLKMYMYFLKDKNNGKLIGSFMIDNIDYHNLEGTLRFVVATDLENKGYGTKMMRIMLEKAFDEIGLYRVVGTVAVDNMASKKIFEKVCFVKEGILRKYYVVKDGKRVDMILYSMLKEEWEEFKAMEKMGQSNMSQKNLQ